MTPTRRGQQGGAAAPAQAAQQAEERALQEEEGRRKVRTEVSFRRPVSIIDLCVCLCVEGRGHAYTPTRPYSFLCIFNHRPSPFSSIHARQAALRAALVAYYERHNPAQLADALLDEVRSA